MKQRFEKKWDSYLRITPVLLWYANGLLLCGFFIPESNNQTGCYNSNYKELDAEAIARHKQVIAGRVSILFETKYVPYHFVAFLYLTFPI